MLEKALKPKAICFIHSCHLASAGTATLDLILAAAIGINELEAIIINNIGLPLDSKYTALDSRIQVIQCSSNPELFELPTLRLIQEVSLNSPNTKILYMHTKGISYVGILGYEVILDWINYMLHFLCTKSEDCLKLLDTYDAAGCNFSEAPKPHFSGNFWWANSSHLKKLDTGLLTDKMSAEWWLHSSSVKPVKAILWNSGKNHFYEVYPQKEYTKVNYDKSEIEYISICNPDRKSGLCNQIMSLISGILSAIKSKKKLVLVDNFSTDINNGSMIQSSKIFDFSRMNKDLSKYNIQVMDVYDVHNTTLEISFNYYF
jgi:hypothetical protein